MDVFVSNPRGIRDIEMKVTIYSADRERARADFRAALAQTSLASAARRIYLRTTVDGLKLRSGPSSDSRVLRTMRIDTYVRAVDKTAEWTKIRLPESREGWVVSSYLAPIN